MKRTVTWLCSLVVVAGFFLVGKSAPAQITPPGDHYNVYNIQGVSLPTPIPVELKDQFRRSFVDIDFMDRFSTPVSKNGEPIIDPEAHLTWWRITEPPVGKVVTIFNQFGTQILEVQDPRYLLLPALKNDNNITPLPNINHFKCYDAVGPPPVVTVTLQDQFGTLVVVVLNPVFFCNPVEKTVDGNFFPIVDPINHLACYEVDPKTTFNIAALVQDQFVTQDILIFQHTFLCVPSLKLGTIPTEESTWGRIKSMYQ